MSRPLAAAGATIALLLLCAGVYQVSAADDDDAITTTLHPGWNLIGWIHEAAPAAALFDQLAGLNLIHDGDERSARRDASDDSAALRTLQPGRGYWLYIDSEQPIEWTRPAEPITRRFHLEPGEQLVAWAGPSDRSIADVLLGLRDQLTVAWRWVAADQRFIPWSPNSDLPAPDMPAFDRGEAVQVNLVEAAEWLHPTGDLPQLQFAGGLHHLPDNFRDVVEADLRFVVEQFVAKFKFEAPAERLHLRIPTTPEALQRQQDIFNGGPGAWAYSPERPGGTSMIVMPHHRWGDNDEPGCGVVSSACSVLAHEYFHILQYELAGRLRERVPGWLLEGTAMWAMHIVFDRREPLFDEAQAFTNELDLASRSDRYDYAHEVGFAAVAMLVERAGAESIVKIWENLGLAAEAGEHWTAGFARAFDVSYPAFLTEFAERRKRVFGVISGRFRMAKSQSLPEIRMHAVGDSPFAWYHADVEPDGRFEFTLLRFEPGTMEPVRYALAISRKDSACTARLYSDGTLSFPSSKSDPDHSVASLDDESVQMLDVQLPAAFCLDRLVFQLVGAYGAGGSFRVQFCIADTSDCVHADQLSGNRFATFVPFEANYWIRVTDYVASCSAYVTDDGLTQDPERASRIASNERSGLSKVRLDSASDSCAPGSYVR